MKTQEKTSNYYINTAVTSPAKNKLVVILLSMVLREICKREEIRQIFNKNLIYMKVHVTSKPLKGELHRQ